MSNSNKHSSTLVDLDSILNYVNQSRGLKAKVVESGKVEVRQELDGKIFSFFSKDVSEILSRTDSEG
ncbi:MAG: hypothetical protein EOP06_08230, partial [Proteobacteria bacterium]